MKENYLEISPSPIPFNELPRLVRFHRKKSGLSQVELARLASVGKTVIFDIEKGKRTTQVNTLLKILAVLNITLHVHSPLIENYLRSSDEKS